MALLELGTKFPCTTQGTEIPIDDENLTISSGEVLELWLEQEEGEGDITTGDGLAFVQDILKMKEEYPYFVLHYINIEARRVTVQYSIAPVGAHESPGLIVGAIVIGIIFLIAILAGGSLYLKGTRGWVFTPTGTAAIKARNTHTSHGISGVKIYCDGDLIGTTDGYAVSTRQLVGEHIFSAAPIAGYLDPYPVTALIELNKNVNVTIEFWPDDIPPPTTGWIDVHTTPVGAQVYINTELVGLSPISVEVDAPGDYTVGFGDLEGYITPPARSVSVSPGARVPVTVEYTTPEGWEKYIWYALTAAGAITAAAIIIPRVIKSLPRKKEGKAA